MTTYSDHQQRELDAASGAEMDRRAERELKRERIEPTRILHLLRVNPRADEALDLLTAALAAEYARGRVDGAQEMGDRLMRAPPLYPEQPVRLYQRQQPATPVKCPVCCGTGIMKWTVTACGDEHATPCTACGGLVWSTP